MQKNHDLKGAVQEQFGRVAASYRTSAVHAKGEDLPAMVEAAELQGHERVLDAGCGAGHTAATFAPHATEVVALDFTDTMLRQVEILAADRGLANITTRLGDVEKIPYANSCFDLVVSRYSAHHWARPGTAMEEIRRVLRPGGKFILSDVVGFDEPVCDTYLNAVEVLRDPSHVRDYTPLEWSGLFVSAGFSFEIFLPYRIFLQFQEWTERMLTPESNRVAIQALYGAAPKEVREALGVTDEGHYFTCAVMRGSAG